MLAGMGPRGALRALELEKVSKKISPAPQTLQVTALGTGARNFKKNRNQLALKVLRCMDYARSQFPSVQLNHHVPGVIHRCGG